jgi:glycosyltransferase involved in cell wall biosynthesis
MMRIIYGAPLSDTPSGGVKVIYRHSEKLNKLGMQSAIWHPGDAGFKCTWFDSSVDVIDTSKLIPSLDFLIVPEIWASSYVATLKSMGFRVGIFVQNCYYTHVNLNPGNVNAIDEAYCQADLILSISKDTSKYLMDILNVPKEKIILQRYSVDSRLFKKSVKSKIITYMPRKMGQHSLRVVSVLSKLIPSDWEIRSLDNMSESEVAKNMSESKIFLAFSEFEGLPVPPVEAAMSGNIVIGYHGQGGKEYWFEPSFVFVEQGDIQNFIKKTIDVIGKIDANEIDFNLIESSIEKIKKYFSNLNEIEMLKYLIKKIGT